MRRGLGWAFAGVLALTSCSVEREPVADNGVDSRARPTVFSEYWRAMDAAFALRREKTVRKWGWQRVRNTDELASMVTLPWREKRPVVVYFFAEWSLWNKDLEEQVLSQPEVKAKLEGFTTI